MKSKKTTIEDSCIKKYLLMTFLSMVVYLVFIVPFLPIFSMGKGENDWIFTIAIILVSFFGVLIVLKIKDETEELIRKTKREIRGHWAGRPAEVNKGKWYKILKIYHIREDTPLDGRKVVRVVALMIESNNNGDFSNSIRDNERIYLFSCLYDCNLSIDTSSLLIHITPVDFLPSVNRVVWRLLIAQNSSK